MKTIKDTSVILTEVEALKKKMGQRQLTDVKGFNLHKLDKKYIEDMLHQQNNYQDNFPNIADLIDES